MRTVGGAREQVTLMDATGEFAVKILDEGTLGKALLRAGLFVLVSLCALPGLVFILRRLIESLSAHPFASNRVEDLWTMVHVVNFFVLRYTSPAFVPLMWAGCFFLRPLLSPFSRTVLTAITGVSSLGVFLFWIWPF